MDYWIPPAKYSGYPLKHLPGGLQRINPQPVLATRGASQPPAAHHHMTEGHVPPPPGASMMTRLLIAAGPMLPAQAFGLPTWQAVAVAYAISAGIDEFIYTNLPGDETRVVVSPKLHNVLMRSAMAGAVLYVGSRFTQNAWLLRGGLFAATGL